MVQPAPGLGVQGFRALGCFGLVEGLGLRGFGLGDQAFSAWSTISKMADKLLALVMPPPC